MSLGLETYLCFWKKRIGGRKETKKQTNKLSLGPARDRPWLPSSCSKLNVKGAVGRRGVGGVNFHPVSETEMLEVRSHGFCGSLVPQVLWVFGHLASCWPKNQRTLPCQNPKQHMVLTQLDMPQWDIGTCFLIHLVEPLIWRNLDVYFFPIVS